jgi:hypothetical protein
VPTDRINQAISSVLHYTVGGKNAAVYEHNKQQAELYIAGILSVYETGHDRLILNPFQFAIHSQSTFQLQQSITF